MAMLGFGAGFDFSEETGYRFVNNLIFYILTTTFKYTGMYSCSQIVMPDASSLQGF